MALRSKRSVSRRAKALAWTSVMMTAVLVLGVLGLYFTVRAKLDRISHIVVVDTANRPKRYTSALNILLLGSDTRAGQNAAIGGYTPGQRSDTIMIAHISPGRGRVTVISIPRDTMVPIYACDATQGAPGQQASQTSEERINATLEYGGPECVRTTIEQQTGIYISNIIQLDFTGFQKVINDVGGVDVCVPVAISDPVIPGPLGHGTGLKLSAGEHHIWGRDALEFWRARYSLADGTDTARIQRDQYLMAQIVKGVLHSRVLSSPSTLLHVVGDIASSMSTDASTSDLVTIASSLSSLHSNEVQFVTAPTGPYPPDTSALEFQQPAAGVLFTAITLDKTLPKAPAAERRKGGTRARLATMSPAAVRVTVLNGTSTSGLAAKVSAELTAAGFSVVGQPADAATSGYVGSVIEYGSAADLRAADTLKQDLSAVTVRLVPGLTAGTLTLIVGSSFTKLATPSVPLGTITGSFNASSHCRNSAFFGANLPAPSGNVACAC